ncbi:hypothetical protein J3D54_004447 [Pseudomonas sp. GGS8]|uniref:hypothetical protein n=1 Tax=Pseudomonas sp. GGS8 TaxID=2817892 RepID=UPI00209E5845|nr:hypothetical protein [Pseudomonas sp. GGS8]MCP1445315.1 hypothetical protein [Pseudomonas sp. GGS8]
MSNKAFNQFNSTSSAFKYTSLGLRLIAALAFLAAGGAKLAGVPMMVEIFEHIGLGPLRRGSVVLANWGRS